MSEERGSACGTLMVFLAGVAVGAVVVALTTPRTGPELRGDLKDLGNRVRDRLKAFSEDEDGAADSAQL